MGWFGLGLLLLTLLLSLSSGWPAYAVVLAVSAGGALCGWAVGAIEPSWLAALPSRVLGLLEHDLLQALALYAVVGALMHRLGLARDLMLDLQARTHSDGLATVLLGALLAPLNGSVGASVNALARATEACTPAGSLHPHRDRQRAWLAAGGTLGVIVPPSIVLLLLGDAMLRAHTEGLNLAAQAGGSIAQAGLRVMNTQDLLQAVLFPGLVLLAGWCVIAHRQRSRGPSSPVPVAQAAFEGSSTRALLWIPALLLVLVVLVAIGRVRPVEGAATAGMALMVWGTFTRRLDRRLLRTVLDDALSLTGALFGLLLAATTLSMLLRALGTDVLVQNALQSAPMGPQARVMLVLAGFLACAAVLDAYEMIFLVVPIVMPPLLSQVDDAAWLATLTLLVLQLGFMLPPFGMAYVLARTQLAAPVAAGADAVPAGRLWPFALWSIATVLLVAVWPACTTWTRSAPATLGTSSMSSDQIEGAMRNMAAPRRNSP